MDARVHKPHAQDRSTVLRHTYIDLLSFKGVPSNTGALCLFKYFNSDGAIASNDDPTGRHINTFGDPLHRKKVFPSLTKNKYAAIY